MCLSTNKHIASHPRRPPTSLSTNLPQILFDRRQPLVQTPTTTTMWQCHVTPQQQPNNIAYIKHITTPNANDDPRPPCHHDCPPNEDDRLQTKTIARKPNQTPGNEDERRSMKGTAYQQKRPPMNKNNRPRTKTTAHEQKQPPPTGNNRLSARERRGLPTNENDGPRTKTTPRERRRPHPQMK
jgi:hypothetical protein